MVEIEGGWNIPTALLYEPGGKVLIGSAALSEDAKLVNEDFKIDLGRYAPGVQGKRRFKTAAAFEKSGPELANDFLIEVLTEAKQWLISRGITACQNIVVAEPLSMHTEDLSPEWLANYRATLRRIIEGKTIFSTSGLKVRFIPEPFAAFQYYRHGIRHPLVAQATQINALVIDFGGGTCDVCIIETTRQGEISGGGRNMRPLAGKSLPLGGFSINREIAEHLLLKKFPAEKSHIRTGIQEYKNWHEGKRSLEALDSRYKVFIDNFHRLIHRVEAVKLALCRAVTDWSLTADQRFPVATTVPQDPFEDSGKAVAATLSIADLREIFIQKIYNPSLKPFLAERLKIGRDVLENRPIHVILLSGGSANIGWVRELLKRDFGDHLSNAPTVQIPDYQQVVAQGLAVDCAREFSTGTSDFKGVTYNPLYLLLSPDDSGCEPRPFFKKTIDLPDVKDRPGLLVPTASVLASFVDRPMLWRVKMGRPPRRKLDYYFLQGTMDPNDVSSLQNVEEHTIHTPPDCDFDGSSHVQLTIKSDGTAVPRIVYRAGTSFAKEIGKDGRKFFGLYSRIYG